jgi:predicted HicB family RNase H-like nuclease
LKIKNNLSEKYTYRVEWSEEDHAHIAHCLEFPSLLAHGNTAEKALSEIESVVATAIEWMSEDGEQVPEPFGTKQYKGNISLRVPADVHRSIAIRAAEEGVSINQYVLSRLSFV